MSAHDLLVEMPPAFDVAGDTGSIGRFNAVSGGSNTSVEMDIKGDTGQLQAAMLSPSKDANNQCSSRSQKYFSDTDHVLSQVPCTMQWLLPAHLACCW